MNRPTRNNNPGNIRVVPNQKWLGSMPVGTRGETSFVVFTNPEYGIRALLKILITYMTKRGCTTTRSIIERYAPSSDGNNTSHYYDMVRSIALTEHETILPEDWSTYYPCVPCGTPHYLCALASSMIRVESSQWWQISAIKRIGDKFNIFPESLPF